MAELVDEKVPDAYEFDQLLVDPSFVDYMNTFLALPVFGKAITYNREEDSFKIDPPVQRTCYHVLQSRVKTWIRDERMPFFWRTDLYLEFILCRQLMNGLRTDVPETLGQIKQHVGQVEGMRNFRRFLHGTMGERIMSFWLEAERFQRHVKADQRRPVSRELQEKYLKSGSPLELPEMMKWRILCDGPATMSKDLLPRLKKKFVKQKYHAGSAVFSNSVFVEVQAMIVDRLSSYWLPKYILHRALVRKKVIRRWRQSVQLKGSGDGNSGPKSVADVVKEVITNQKLRVEKQSTMFPAQQEVDEFMENSRVSSTDSMEEQTPADAEIATQRRLEQWREWFWGPVDKREEEERLADKPAVHMVDGGCTESFPVSIHSNASTSRVTRDMHVPDEEIPRPPSETHIPLDSSSPHYSASYSFPAQPTSLVCTLERAKSEPAVQPALVYDDLSMSERQEYYEDIDDCEKVCQLKQGEQKKVKTVDKNELRLNLPKPQPPFAQSRDLSKPMTVYQALVEENDQRERERLGHNAQSPGAEQYSSSGEGSPVHVSPCTLPSLRLPPIHHVNSKPKTAYPPHFAEYHKILLDTEDTASKQHLLAALTTDSLAGGPFHRYLKRTRNREALDRLHFWADVQRFLVPAESLGIIKKYCMANSIIDTYIESSARRNLGLSAGITKQLVNVLPSGHGDALLLYIAQDVVQLMGASWSEYARADEDHFISSVTVRRKKNAKKRDKRESVKSSGFGPRAKLSKVQLKALQLALSLTLTGFDNAIDEGEEREEEGEFKYQVPVLKVAKDSLAEWDADARRSSHFYGRVTKEATDIADSNSKQSATKSRPPKPRTFQDILSDPVHLLWFKRFLTEKSSEIPLLFWQAVEGMKSTCKDGKARQARATAIVRKYFVNINTSAVDNLQCRADIIREIPVLEKVTPAMLVSAQACVTRSIDEKWFGEYLATFPEEEVEGDNFIKYALRNTLAGVYKLACHGKTRGLWAMFAHNVMSFQRGIHKIKTLPEFTVFLRREAQATVELNIRRHALNPTRRMINNKFIYMDRLVSDLEFWLEVERFKALADNATECARAGNYSLDDERLLHDKAKTIVKCYIDSDFAPRIQINIPNDMAENIVGLVQGGIIERGLFHEAALSVFIALIHFWKKFAAEAPGGETKSEFTAPSTGKKSELKKRRLSFISGVPYRRVFLPQENEVRWMFSLHQGLRLVVPIRLADRAPARRDLQPDLAPLPSVDGTLI